MMASADAAGGKLEKLWDETIQIISLSFFLSVFMNSE